MLSDQKVNEIRELIAQSRMHGGLTMRQIAIRAGVNRMTVVAIARGTRNVHERVATPDDRGPVARCPTCGAKVEMPCLKCSLEGQTS